MENIIELLSDPERARIVMQSLTAYVIYIYPGVITIGLLSFLEARTMKYTPAFAIKCFSVSYIYNTILAQFMIYEEWIILYNAVLFVEALLIPYIWYKIKYSETFSKVCNMLGIRTCMTSVPFELMKDKEEEFTCIKVYLNDNKTAYTGFVLNYEYELDFEKYIILSGYIKYITENSICEKVIQKNDAKQCNEKVYIKLSEVKAIEKISEERARKELYTDYESEQKIELQKFKIEVKKNYKSLSTQVKAKKSLDNYYIVNSYVDSLINKLDEEQKEACVKAMICDLKARCIKDELSICGIVIALLVGGATILASIIGLEHSATDAGIILLLGAFVIIVYYAARWMFNYRYDKNSFIIEVLQYKLKVLQEV